MNKATQLTYIVRRYVCTLITNNILRYVGLGIFLVLSFAVFVSSNYIRTNSTGTIYAQPAETINFQARLLNAGGNIVPDGNYSVEFRLYDESAGGVSQWTETQSVDVRSGYLSAYLGINTSFPSTIDWSQQQWLTMNVEADGEMSPRIRVTAVPFALQAGFANEAGGLVSGIDLLTADDFLQTAPAAIQSINESVAGLRFNQTGSGGLVQLQGDGVDRFVVNKSGTVTIGGGLQIGTTSTSTAGMLRWTGSDFEGYDGIEWVSLTSGEGGVSGDFFEQGGNAFDATAILGTMDTESLTFITNNTTRMTVGSSGSVTISDGLSVVSGGVTANSFTGSGAGLTALNADELTAGIIDDDRLSANVARLNLAQTFTDLITLDSGAVLGNTTTTTAGALRWNGVDFEGYDGSEWLSLTSGGSGLSALSLGMIHVYETAASVNVSGGWTDLSFNTQARVDSQFSHTISAAPITIQEDGWYEITYYVSTDGAGGGNSNATAQARLVEDTGSGYTQIPGSLGSMLHRSGGDSGSNAAVTVLREFQAGDLIKLQAQQSAGGLTITTVPGAVGVTIRNIAEAGEGSGGGGTGLEFVQGGNEFGTKAIVGTTDNQGLDIITNNQVALAFSSGGLATFSEGVTITSGGLSVTGDSTVDGMITVLGGIMVSAGGLDLSTTGITNAGDITGVGEDITAVNGLTISSGNNSNLNLSAASGVLGLDAATWRRSASGTTTIELNDGAATTLSIVNTDSSAAANLSVEGVVSASNFSGGGAGLTGLSATNITSGTLEDERLTSNIARLNESQTFSGLTSFSGGLTLGNTATTAAGTLRWTGADFEGYDGSEWVSLTGGGSGQGGYASSRLTTSFSGNINQATETVIEWDAQNSIDSPPFNHSTGTNPGRLTVTEDGTYRIYANLSFTSTIVRANPKMQFRLNGSILLDGTSAGGYIRSASGHNTASTNLMIVEELEAGDYIEVISSQDANSGLVTLLPGESVFIVETALAGTTSGSGGGGSGLEFTQGGNAFGSTALLGTTDAYGIDIITDGSVALAIDALGDATFTGSVSIDSDLAVDGLVTARGGLVTIGSSTQAGSLEIYDSTGNRATINAGSLSADRTFTLPDASGEICTSAGNCDSGGDDALLLGGNTSTEALVVGAINNQDFVIKTNDTNRLRISGNDGNVNLLTGGLQTLGTTRLTSGGALQNITGLSIISGGANIAGGITISGGASISGGLNNNNGGLTNAGVISGATTITASGNINTSGGALQTNGVTRLTNTGALQNISTITASGNIDTTTGAIQTNGVTRIANNGNLTNIGSITASGAISTGVGFVANGLSGVNGSCSGNNDYLVNFTLTGGIVTDGSCRQSGGFSDMQLKENVVSLDSSTLDGISRINTVNFDFKCEEAEYDELGLDCDRQTGVIAQELAEVFPELVYEGDDGYLRVRYDALNIYTLRAVTELAKIIDSTGTVNAKELKTDGAVRISKDGKLTNITGLSLVGGGASITGGIDNNLGGITNVGAIKDVTDLSAQSITLKPGVEELALRITKEDADVFTIADNGALDIYSSDSHALGVRDQDGKSVFRVDSQNGLVYIGEMSGSAETVLLVLAGRDSPDDPEGVEGAQYYNRAMQRFRCYQDGRWQNCIAQAITEYLLLASEANVVVGESAEMLAGSSEVWVDLSLAYEARLQLEIASIESVDGAVCTIAYALEDDLDTWLTLVEDIAIEESGVLRTDWKTLPDEAKAEVLVRINCQSATDEGDTTMVLRSVRLQIR